MLFLTLLLFGLDTEINNLIKDSQIYYGIAIQDLNSNQTWLFNAERVVHAASTMKVPVMLEVFRRVDKGDLSLDQKIRVETTFKSVIDGSPFTMDADPSDPAFEFVGKEATILDLVKPMITHSSNLATNNLVHFLGPQKISVFMDQIGASNMTVRRALYDMKAFDANLNNDSDAKSFLACMVATTRSDLFTDSSRNQMFEILSQQHYRDMIPAGLPADFKGEIGNKTGSISRVQHDGAVIHLDNGQSYALVIYTADFGEDRAQAIKTSIKISQTVHNFFASKD